MKFTLSWLKERHLQTNASLADITKTLTDIGLEVESVENPGAVLHSFLTGEILSTTPHPDADRLKVCQVSIGQDKPLQVVCGGINARAGIKVVLAQPGVTIPSNGMKMRVSKIRGVESHGMLCSGEELLLDLGPKDGIIELPSETPVGLTLTEALPLDDPVIEIVITPNRGDCLGVRGIARDLSTTGVGTLRPLVLPDNHSTFESPIKIIRNLPQDRQEACPHFMGRYIKGVKNRPSPLWLQERLKAIGIAPISALVDITNFFTFDLPRPLHVFDADKITGNLTIRMGAVGEKIEALNHHSYAVDPSITVVADEKRVQGLGGIIGSAYSGCTMDTTNVFLEAAYFDPKRTAATGRKLGVMTDARYCFERGVDPHSTPLGIELGTALILDLCGGEASEVVSSGHPIQNQHRIAFPSERTKELTSVPVSADESHTIFTRLGIEVENETKDAMVCRTPSWRYDLTGPADLVEEIMRIKGYDLIPALPLPIEEKTAFPLSLLQQRTIQIRHYLAAQGLHEVISWSMIPDSHARLFGGTIESTRICNPISQDLEWMRPSLLPPLLDMVKKNVDRGQDQVHLFEIGCQYAGNLPTDQANIVAAIGYGKEAPSHWSVKPAPLSFYHMKSDILGILKIFGLTPDKVQFTREGLPSWYHPGKACVVQQGPKRILAYLGELHPHILQSWGLKKPACAFELFLDHLPLKAKKSFHCGKFSPSNLQKVMRDFGFLVPRALPAQDLVDTIKKVAPTLISEIRIFDVYEGPNVPDTHKVMAFHVTLQPQKETLTDEEIKKVYNEIIANADTLGAKLRL